MSVEAVHWALKQTTDEAVHLRSLRPGGSVPAQPGGVRQPVEVLPDAWICVQRRKERAAETRCGQAKRGEHAPTRAVTIHRDAVGATDREVALGIERPARRSRPCGRCRRLWPRSAAAAASDAERETGVADPFRLGHGHGNEDSG